MSMGFPANYGQIQNISDFYVDISSREFMKFLEKQDAAQRAQSEGGKPPAPLQIEELNLLLIDSKKLRTELDNKMHMYIENYKEKVDNNKEKNDNRKGNTNIVENQIHIQEQHREIKEKPPSHRNHFDNLYVKPIIDKNPKASQARHHDKKNVAKSTRNDRMAKPPPGPVNKNSVWYRAEPFFQPLPLDDEINKMFASINTARRRKEAIHEPVEHWTIRMNKFVRSKMQALPKPPPTDDHGESDFWKKIQLPFQIESMQKRNFSSFHNLLNMFVELDGPLEKKERELKPLTYHALIPQVKSETYLALNFEQRLLLEIESLGLIPNEQDGNMKKSQSPFDSEIQAKINENDNEILPVLIELQNELVSNIDTYRKEQRIRMEKYEESQEKLSHLIFEK
ncbi:hypothetical protein TRFO_26998 [Tritrichomonas foetus]|uniref:Uncharacterized protein n=1 Tax=Tritrichomonas foetus TaxID=1144522 RepID=A0A1J4K7B1_9EUKA|nr:hypothetical protein TRFO_26998 [Tritrichomonas foetus]|eukprot:OHT05301.1 hypothetical protein TRFO_26998 [Tritrichomonas foetus]